MVTLIRQPSPIALAVLTALAYLRTLDIVDKDNSGLEGHTTGVWAPGTVASVYPDDYKMAVTAQPDLVLEGNR